jgi:hypothetical protein
MRDAQLAHLGEVAQRAGVEDQHARAVYPQQDRDAIVRDVLGDDGHARIVREQRSQAEREQILEAGDCNRDRRAYVHEKVGARTGAHGIHRHDRDRG